MMITFVNSLDHDEVRLYVMPDLNPNSFHCEGTPQRIEKIDEKPQQATKNLAKLPSRQRVKTCAHAFYRRMLET